MASSGKESDRDEPRGEDASGGDASGEDASGDRDPHEDLTDAEVEALHELQLGVEHVYRGYGALLACHHHVGCGMDHFDVARERLREAGHDEYADRLSEEILPAGFFGDRWTYELVDDAREGFLREMTAFEAAVRADLADGHHHVSERRQQRQWRQRAQDGE